MTTEQENILELFNNDYTELAEILSKSTGNESWFNSWIDEQVNIIKFLYIKHYKKELSNEESREMVYKGVIDSPYDMIRLARRMGANWAMVNAINKNYNFINELHENETTKRFKINYS